MEKRKKTLRIWWLGVMGLLFGPLVVEGIGLGVSPPELILDDGIGRLTLFNPGDGIVEFSIEHAGQFLARPSRGSIPSHGAASILVSGDGGGFVRILAASADQSSPIALPAMDVPVKGAAGSPRILFVLMGVAGALGLVTICFGSFMVLRKRLERRVARL